MGFYNLQNKNCYFELSAVQEVTFCKPVGARIHGLSTNGFSRRVGRESQVC